MKYAYGSDIIRKNSMIPFPWQSHPCLVGSWCLLHSSAVLNSTLHQESSAGLGASQLFFCLPSLHGVHRWWHQNRSVTSLYNIDGWESNSWPHNRDIRTWICCTHMSATPGEMVGLCNAKACYWDVAEICNHPKFWHGNWSRWRQYPNESIVRSVAYNANATCPMEPTKHEA